jgi:hypothetical protein
MGPSCLSYKSSHGSIDGWTEAVDSSGAASADGIAGAREAAVAQYTTVPR